VMTINLIVFNILKTYNNFSCSAAPMFLMR
jgi:hypothetical protein